MPINYHFFMLVLFKKNHIITTFMLNPVPKCTLLFLFSEFKFRTIRILATDYTNYAVAYTCVNVGSWRRQGMLKKTITIIILLQLVA